MRKLMTLALCFCIAVSVMVSVTACSRRDSTGEPEISQNKSVDESPSIPSEQEIDNESADSSDNEPLEQNRVQEKDDIRDKTFIVSRLNLALSDDGYLYSFHDDAGTGKLDCVEIARDVKKLDGQYTDGNAPLFQTNDNRYYRQFA